MLAPLVFFPQNKNINISFLWFFASHYRYHHTSKWLSLWSRRTIIGLKIGNIAKLFGCNHSGSLWSHLFDFLDLPNIFFFQFWRTWDTLSLFWLRIAFSSFRNLAKKIILRNKKNSKSKPHGSKTNRHDVQMFAKNDFFNWPLKNIVMMLAKEAFNYFALMKTFKLVAGTSSIA